MNQHRDSPIKSIRVLGSPLEVGFFFHPYFIMISNFLWKNINIFPRNFLLPTCSCYICHRILHIPYTEKIPLMSLDFPELLEQLKFKHFIVFYLIKSLVAVGIRKIAHLNNINIKTSQLNTKIFENG